MSDPYSAYRQSQVLAASPVQLIHLAYEGAIAAISDAQACCAPEQRPRRKAAITKAQLIIGELRSTLDFAAGGDIALQLARLYDYMQAELRNAVFSVPGESLQTVKNLLTTLDEAWAQISTESHPIAAAPFASSWAAREEVAVSSGAYSL